MNTATDVNKTQTPKSDGGYEVGRSATDKVGFYGTTPIVQPSGASQAAVGTAAATTTTPHGFATGTQADAIVTLVNEMRSVLVNLGLMAGS